MKIVLSALAFLCSVQIYAQNLTGKQISSRSKPGVVMIYSKARANVVYSNIAVNDAKIQELSQLVVVNVNAGKISSDQVIDVFIKAIFSNPQLYFYSTNEIIKKELSVGAIGTGFILNDKGYVATNCHVIDLVQDEDQTKRGFAEQIIVELAKNFISGLSKSLNATLTDEEKNFILNGLATYYLSTGSLQVDKIEKDYGVRFGIDVSGIKVEQVKQASVVTKGQAIPGKDVAILKIEAKDIPTVLLGEETSTQEGDKIYVMGFPGDATFHPMVGAESVFVPTFTQGIVSAIKTAKTGWNLYQIDAAVDHGNSGGPVFNEKGEVIGLATFGTVDMTSGETKQNYNFFVPVSILKEFMNQVNIRNETSEITKEFNQALQDFEKQRYKSALSTFLQIEQVNANFPYIKTYISDCQSNISKGLDKTPFLSLTWWVVIAIMLLIGIVTGLILLLRRK
jgi:S1-C subfamily serine protease